MHQWNKKSVQGMNCLFRAWHLTSFKLNVPVLNWLVGWVLHPNRHCVIVWGNAIATQQPKTFKHLHGWREKKQPFFFFFSGLRTSPLGIRTTKIWFPDKMTTAPFPPMPIQKLKCRYADSGWGSKHSSSFSSLFIYFFYLCFLFWFLVHATTTWLL